ncbi:protein kinase domain-containing protein [Streptomyces sp. LZ34]
MREPGAVTLSSGRFTPLEELGRGGMGVVWRAKDRVLGRQVAIKQLLPPSGLSPDARGTMRARMLREARAAAQLDHRSAVTVHDVLVDEDSVLIVMEMVKAVTLHKMVEREGPLPPARVAAIGLDMLDVLTEAHGLGWRAHPPPTCGDLAPHSSTPLKGWPLSAGRARRRPWPPS